jgi:hypothetical protein
VKSKTNLRFICILLLCTGITNQMIAQLQSNTNKSNQIRGQIHGGRPDIYTYKVFLAPNRMFGYDVFQNGKGVFHQPALFISSTMVPSIQQPILKEVPTVTDPHPRVTGFSQKEYAENAARLSIEKIKKRTSPSLTNVEMDGIITKSKSSQTLKH